VADIFREIDEDLRRESAERIWRKYGTVIIAAIVVVMLAAVGWVGWREWRESRLGENGVVLAQALDASDSGQTERATAMLETLAAEGSGAYPLLARFNLAAASVESGDTAGALDIYRSIADDSNTPAPYRDLAVVLLALHGLQTVDPNEMIGRLEPLRQNSPLRPTATELTALLQHRAGDDVKARETLASLLEDPAIPPAMRDRVTRLHRIFGGQPMNTVAG